MRMNHAMILMNLNELVKKMLIQLEGESKGVFNKWA